MTRAGNAPPGNAYAGNGYAGTDLEGNQNDSNYSVQRIHIGTKVAPRPDGAVPTISIRGRSLLHQEAAGDGQPEECVQRRAQCDEPYAVPVGTTIQFYRASN